MVWRRIVVPVNLNFHQLHKIVQTAFGWLDYHLHEFYIYDIKGNHHTKAKTPILKIVSDAQAFDYGDDNIPMELDHKLKLSDFFPAHNTIRYNYDFGDDWQHDIEMESYIDKYDKNYPVCLDGAGTTPPEDVGGESGYMNFLKTIADKSNPDHEEMTSWGQSQRYKEFDIKTVNFFLNL